MPAPLPKNEAARLEALRQYNILDTQPEQAYDDITRIASIVCDVPIALITIVDAKRQWFKSKVGLDGHETPRDQAFCAYTILQQDVLSVEDATKDPRFSTNPLVNDEPNIRFYAGAPLIDAEGQGLGSLCIIDDTPRALEPKQREVLEALARQVVALLESRRVSSLLATALKEVKVLADLLPICAYCKSVRNDKGYYEKVEEYIRQRTSTIFSHTICPKCAEVHFPGFKLE